MKLSQLKENQRGIIVKVRGRGAFRKRIIEMGFVKGKEVKVVKYAPLKDPIEYNIMGYEVSLRRSEADLIEVVPIFEQTENFVKSSNGQSDLVIFSKEEIRKRAAEKAKEINVALVGNPNSGKTTLFNFASGSTEHVGNYGGVTVEAKKATFKHKGYTFNITDLPGTYSLSAYSPEELFVRKHIIEEMPDVVINVVDASNLERNLYLTAQLIDLDTKIVIALNMFDELQKKGDKLDIENLAVLLGSPIVPTIAPKGYGIDKLLDTVIEVFEDRHPHLRHIHINYGKEIENAIKSIQKKIKIPENQELTDRVSTRFIAIKLLEKDKDIEKLLLEKAVNPKEIIHEAQKQIKKLETHLKEDTETLITDARYGFIAGALRETYQEGKIDRFKTTKLIDSILTNKYLGFPIFLFFLWLMFVSTFKIGEYPQAWLEKFVEITARFTDSFMSDGMLKDLLIDGIINGVGSVLVFLPNILILFLFISFMEDTGYMARVAFIMDKLMHKIGLHGKSFIPLLMGFGCNVPAIMATRTIENRQDRLLTILINPFMSCSARLPIYLLIIGTVFPAHQGTILFAIYATGILVAIIMALIFKKVLFKSKEAPFVMELPPYRMPTLKVTMKHMWHKTREYLKKMGGVILVASIIIWALGYFPRQKQMHSYFQDKILETRLKYKMLIASETDTAKKTYLQKHADSIVNALKMQEIYTHQANSYIGKLGKFFEPVMRPLGFDWRMTVATITGISAKEIVVSTMAVLFQSTDETSLSEKLKNSVYDSGKHKGEKIFTPVTALAFLVFVLLYFPCIASVTAIAKESGSWKWAAFAVFYTTSLAWLLAFIIYQVGNLTGLS